MLEVLCLLGITFRMSPLHMVDPKTDNTLLQIQGRFQACYTNIACFCGIIIRERNNVIGVDTCRTNYFLVVRHMEDLSVGRQVVIKQHWGYNIEVIISYQYHYAGATYLHHSHHMWSHSFFFSKKLDQCLLTFKQTHFQSSFREVFCGSLTRIDQDIIYFALLKLFFEGIKIRGIKRWILLL